MALGQALIGGPSHRTWLLVLLASGLFAIQQGFFSPLAFRLNLYIHGSIVFAILSVLALATAAVAYIGSWRDSNHRYFDCALALGICLVLLIAVPGRTLVEADESIMISTAQGIYHNFTPFAATIGVYQNDGNLIPLFSVLDKRGVLFPVLIAALDWTLGPNVDHRLWLSWFSALVALVVLIRLARRILPPAVVPSVAIFLAAMPVFSIHARGGTFDTMNVAAVLLMTHIQISFLARPSYRGLALVLAAAAVAGQIRNESILLAGMAIVSILFAISFLRGFEAFQRPVVWLAPWVLIPSAIRRALPFDDELLDPTVVAWSFSNFQDNVWAAFQVSAFGGAFHYGNAIVGLFAALGLGVVAAGWPKRRRHQIVEMRPLALMALPIFVITIILLFYTHGRPDSPLTARYFILLACLLCLLAGLSFRILAHRSKLQGAVSSLVALYAFWLSSYWTIEAPQLAALPKSSNAAAVSRILGGQSAQCEAVLVSNFAIHLLVRGFTTMGRRQLNALGVEEIERLAGRQLDVIDLVDFEESKPSEFASAVWEKAGGSCNLVQTDIRAPDVRDAPGER